MVRIFATLVLIASIVLFPPSVLAFISQNAVPGDGLYPVKRKLEEGVLLVASLTPMTKAWFSTNLAKRRFQETKVLIAKGDTLNAAVSIDGLVDQSSITAVEIKKVTNSTQKKELVKDFKRSLREFNRELTLTSVQLRERKSPSSKPIPTPAPFKTSELPLPQATNAPPPPSGDELKIKIDDAIKKIDDLDKKLDAELKAAGEEPQGGEKVDIESIYDDLDDNDHGELESLLNKVLNQYKNSFPNINEE